MKNPQMKGGSWLFSILAIVLSSAALLVSSCQPDILEPPRLATQTAQLASTPTTPPTPFISEAPTPTPGPRMDRTSTVEGDEPANNSITVWINETSDSHERKLKEMADIFSSESGIHVEVVLVSPALLPELVSTAVLSDTLPDLILHPIEFSHGWATEGILNPEAASEVLTSLGEDTFDPAAIDILRTNSERDDIVALPSDGWQQLIVYRSDWFQELGLNPPDSYESLSAAAEAIFQPEGPISGLVVPTDASLTTTQQVFEHLATANGCPLVDNQGRVALLHPACLEAMEYYRMLVNDYSPIGFQTDTSALNAYISGRTGLILSSPSVLPVLAGLDDNAVPNCPDCSTPDYLADNSGFVTEIVGTGEFAGGTKLGEIMALGITSSADEESATTFAEYWFKDGYLPWLGVDPERKVPFRWGDSQDPMKFLDAWGNLPMRPGSPSLNQQYGPELVEQLREGVVSSTRWGFQERQGELMTRIYEELILAPILQEMLSGYFTSSQSIVEMYKAVVEVIPDYSFPIEVAPSPTP